MKDPVDVDSYLDRLRELPFVKTVELHRPGSPDRQLDARITLRTPKGRHEMALKVRNSPATLSAAQSFLVRALRDVTRPWLVFSPYVSRPVGQVLASHGIGFVDQAGNCHISIGQDYVAHIEGRRPQLQPRRGRGLGARSYQVLFALLARPEMAAAPIRSLALAAGVGKTAAADLVTRLREEGLLLRGKPGHHLARPDVLLDRWVAGYADKLRPRLLLGRYRSAAGESTAFESSVEATLGEGRDWAWGGATAAYRLTRHYQSATTTLHAGEPATRVRRDLGLLPSKNGPVVILGVPGPLALEGPAPHVAHPLLVYSELVLEGNDRALEAAAEIRSRFLREIR